MTINKNLLRKEITIKLRELTAQDCELASQTIVAKVVQSKIFIQSKNIACYIPLPYEVDIWSIIKNIWYQGKNCYVPAFSSSTENQLCFVKFEEHDQLFKIKLGILAPKIEIKKVIGPKDLDLVMVPLLGFNSNKFRLGRGAGYYDRALAFKKTHNSSKPYLLGVGYKCQLVDFKPDSWDVKLDKIVTA